MLSHDFGRDQFDDKRNAQRDEDQIVHIANDRDEIRNQINWRGCVSRDSNGKRFCIPRHTRITGGKIKCVSIAAYGARPFLPTINHSIVFPVRLGLTNVRFESKADIRGRLGNVRFTPESRHWNSAAQCPLCAKSGHSLFYSMISSASAERFGGTSMPSALAVLRLMTNSNLTDCTTGKSAGFSPLRILPA